jgi:hypothetical protein
MQIESNQQWAVLSTVFESVVVSPEGIAKAVLRRPFDKLGRPATV